MLQRIKKTTSNGEGAFYISLDDLWFKTHSSIELVDYLYVHGVSYLYLDEVHRYPDWIRNLKNINEVKNYKSLSKPEKIYLNNTNLMYALTPTVDKGKTFDQIKDIPVWKWHPHRGLSIWFSVINR